MGNYTSNNLYIPQHWLGSSSCYDELENNDIYESFYYLYNIKKDKL